MKDNIIIGMPDYQHAFIGWISIKNRIPQNKAPFIGSDGKIIFVAYWNRDSYEVGGWENCFMCGGLNRVSFKPESYALTVTHWMPLPELPKKEAGEQ